MSASVPTCSLAFGLRTEAKRTTSDAKDHVVVHWGAIESLGSRTVSRVRLNNQPTYVLNRHEYR